MWYLIHKCTDEFSFKYVTQRNPVQEPQQSFQCGMDQWGILGVFLLL